MYRTDENFLMKKVEITGTREIMLKLFLSYWQYKTKIKNNTTGEIATHTVMGDHVSLIGIDAHSSKIIITPSQFDYSGCFDIGAP